MTVVSYDIGGGPCPNRGRKVEQKAASSWSSTSQAIAAVNAIRARGHDVAWIREDSPGITDGEVFSRAVGDNRVLVTVDKDFGELVFRVGVPAQCDVVLFRILPTSPTDIAQAAVAVLENRADWAGHFSVIEATKEDTNGAITITIILHKHP